MSEPLLFREHGAEPVHGLPERLPDGETVLWQGSPDWEAFACHALHVRLIAAYFALLVAWSIGGGLSAGAPAGSVVGTAARVVAVGAAGCLLLVLFAWLVGRSTVYTITSRRLVFRFGVALPMTVNLPFSAIRSAAVKQRSNGHGDIVLSLAGEKRVGYIVMWPHVRPWRAFPAQPMLRAIPEPGVAAQILGRALAADAGVAAPVLATNADGRPQGLVPAAANGPHVATA